MCNPHSIITSESEVAARQCRFQDRNSRRLLASPVLNEALASYPHARCECDKYRRACPLHQPFP